MARKGMTGQLNMFDFFGTMDENAGEVEMVSLMPRFDEEPESEVTVEPEPVEKESEAEVTEEAEVVVEEVVPVVEPVAEQLEPALEEEPQKPRRKSVVAYAENEKPAMSRTYTVNGEQIEIAYLNYNKVRITKGKHAPEVKEFENSKAAVDYYVELMHSYESEDE